MVTVNVETETHFPNQCKTCNKIWKMFLNLFNSETLDIIEENNNAKLELEEKRYAAHQTACHNLRQWLTETHRVGWMVFLWIAVFIGIIIFNFVIFFILLFLYINNIIIICGEFVLAMFWKNCLKKTEQNRKQALMSKSLNVL